MASGIILLYLNRKEDCRKYIQSESKEGWVIGINMEPAGDVVLNRKSLFNSVPSSLKFLWKHATVDLDRCFWLYIALGSTLFTKSITV